MLNDKVSTISQKIDKKKTKCSERPECQVKFVMPYNNNK